MSRMRFYLDKGSYFSNCITEFELRKYCHTYLVYTFHLYSLSELYTSHQNITEVAKSLGLTEFVKLLTLSELESELNVEGGRFTAFIPSDEAFLALPQETKVSLLKDRKKLQQFVLFHVAPGKLVSQGFKDNQLIKTLDSPHKLLINVDEDKEVCGGK